MSQTVKDRIIEQVDRLDDPQRRQLLDFARRLASPAGVPGRDLLRLAGSIDPADLEAMSQGDTARLRKGEPAWLLNDLLRREL